jgi:hypothetical protein
VRWQGPPPLMLYSELLQKLAPHGIHQVGRLTAGGDSSVYLGRPAEIVFPFGDFDIHTFYAPANVDDFWLDPEEIAALLRRFNLTLDHL